MQIVSLSTAPIQVVLKIHKVVPLYDNDLIATRLHDLGFISTERLKIIARTLFEKGPLVVQIDQTRFALRYSEASRILVSH